MPETLTIRLPRGDRETLAAEAARRGQGLSAYVRQLAEADALRIRHEAIRAAGDQVVAYVLRDEQAAAELEEIGTPAGDDE